MRSALLTIPVLSVLLFLPNCGRPQPNPAPPAATTIDLDRFVERFIKEENGQRSTVMYLQNGNFVKGWESIDALFLVPGEPDMVLSLNYSEGAPPTHRMQLQLLRRIEGAPTLRGDYTDPHVVATLDEDQVEVIFERGVPDALRQEMVDKALTHGWRENRPLNGRFRQILEIDAAPFLKE